MPNAATATIVDTGRGEPISRRVLIVAPQPFFSDRGTPIAILEVIRALRERRYEVDVLTYPLGRDPGIDRVRIFRSRNPFGIRHVKIGFSWRKLVLDVLLTVSMFRLARRGRYACIHAVEEAAFPAVFLCRRLNIPLVYDMQSSLPEQMSTRALFRIEPIRLLLKRAERWLLTNADVVACSLGLQSYVHSINPKVRVQEWWFPGQRFPVQAARLEKIRAEFGITRDSRVILYSGTFERYQGLEELIKAMPAVLERVPNAVLLLVGNSADQPFALSANGRQLVEAGRIHVIPRQPPELIPSFYAVSDVLVSPRNGGSNIPLKIFDYMAAGRPIVATDIHAHRQVLCENVAALVTPAADSIAAAIVDLLTDRQEADRIGAAARSFAEHRLGWVRFSESVNTIYEHALQTRRSQWGVRQRAIG